MADPIRPRVYNFNGCAVVGNLSAEEQQKLRTATDSELRAMGRLRHNKMLARRAMQINGRVDTGKGEALNREMRGESIE